jgi:hypothetical protein
LILPWKSDYYRISGTRPLVERSGAKRGAFPFVLPAEFFEPLLMADLIPPEKRDLARAYLGMAATERFDRAICRPMTWGRGPKD